MIFLVDDNDELRIALEEFIAALGFDVRTYAAAEDALAALESHGDTLRLLITDVSLPGRDGFSLAHIMQRRIPGLPVIVITAGQYQSSTSANRSNDKFELMRKPVPLGELAKRIVACQATSR